MLLAWVSAFGLWRGLGRADATGVCPVSPLTGAAVKAFSSEVLPTEMRTEKIPGMVFVVVSGDRVLADQGYGFADVENHTRVSATTTVFRVASISKIFTAASVLQLVHEHLLNLHRNVNRYLTSFRIAPAFGAPVTLFDLLTHSSGFDVCHLDYAAWTEAQRLSLRRYLAEFQPVRVRPPELFSGYDNYGYALAGYLVQKASGLPFSDYVQEHLLEPFDMDHSSFAPPRPLRRELATGYWLDDGQWHPYPQSHVNITPAAGLCSTASDMSRFLIALLADRSPNGDRAFPGGVLRGLETQQFAFNPAVPGRCFGFDQVDLDGRQVLRQTGQWQGFNSLLLLSPRQHCGLFLAYNRCDQLHMGWQIARLFAQQFLALPRTAEAAVPAPAPNAGLLDSLCGSYLSVRYPQDSLTLGVPAGIKVSKGQGGQLDIGGRPYREMEPMVFEQVAANGIPGRRVVFRFGRDGRVADLITEGGAYRRVPWIETRQGRGFFMWTAALVFLSVLLAWPIRFIIRDGPLRYSRLAHGVAFAACVLALWLEVSLPLAEWRVGPFADFFGVPSSIRCLIEVMPVLILLTLVLAGLSVRAWWRRSWTLADRLHYSLIPVALALVLYVFHWQHLLFVDLPGRGLV